MIACGVMENMTLNMVELESRMVEQTKVTLDRWAKASMIMMTSSSDPYSPR